VSREEWWRRKTKDKGQVRWGEFPAFLLHELRDEDVPVLGAWFSLKFTELRKRANETHYTLSGNIKPFSRAPEIRCSKTHHRSRQAEDGCATPCKMYRF